MTAEAIEKCLQRDASQRCSMEDAQQLAEAAALLTEADRRKLSKIVIAKLAEPTDHRHYSSRYHEFLQLAALAVCPLGTVKKITSFYEFEPAALKVLCDRRPDWIDKWIADTLAKNRFSISWWFFGGLLNAGACTKPDSEAYVRYLAQLDCFVEPWGGRRGQNQNFTARSDFLRANPLILADLWRFFEVDTGVFHMLGDHLVAGPAPDEKKYEDWADTLLSLSQTGHLDRQRLLTATLRALNSPFAANSLTGFVRFYDRLNPSSDERRAAQPSFCELLACRNTHVVKFALDQLGELQKAKLLDSAAYLAAAPAVFALKPKGQPQAALALGVKLTKEHPELVPEVANLSIEALQHESSDVQAAAVKLLEGWQARLHRDLASELRAKDPGLAASIRPRVQALIAALDSSSAPAAEATNNDPFSLEEWQARAETIPAGWCSLAGVDEALEMAAGDQLFQGVWFSPNYVPVLTSCEPIVPIDTVDELLDAVAHALEEIESADQLERILDGVSRLCGERPPDFEHRAKPLVARLLSDKRDNPRGILGFTLSAKLAQLLLRWLGENGQVRFQSIDDPRSLSKFIERRLREIEARVVANKPAPLVSAPTHQHGWLDARVFVERLRTSATPPIADLIQALLRLAPDGKAEALENARDFPGFWGEAVRFALGGPGPTAEIPSDDAFSIWFAAARARYAYGPLGSLTAAAGTQRVHLLTETKVNWELISADPTNRWFAGRSVAVKLTVEGIITRHDVNMLRPTIALREEAHNRWENFGPEWSHAWMVEVWPANLDGLLVDAIRHLSYRLDAPSSAFDPNHLYLRPWLEPDRPLNELAWLALWIALVSKDAGSRGMALDVLITAIEDGRAILPSELLLRIAAGPWLKLNRVAEVARETARVSPRHAWWFAELLQRFVAHLPVWPTEMHHLLSVLLELLSELQLAIGDEWRTRIESQPASGKSAKLQKSLLVLQTAPHAAARQQAHELALEATLRRAERWAGGSVANILRKPEA